MALDTRIPRSNGNAGNRSEADRNANMQLLFPILGDHLAFLMSSYLSEHGLLKPFARPTYHRFWHQGIHPGILLEDQILYYDKTTNMIKKAPLPIDVVTTKTVAHTHATLVA